MTHCYCFDFLRHHGIHELKLRDSCLFFFGSGVTMNCCVGVVFAVVLVVNKPSKFGIVPPDKFGADERKLFAFVLVDRDGL